MLRLGDASPRVKLLNLGFCFSTQVIKLSSVIST